MEAAAANFRRAGRYLQPVARLLCLLCGARRAFAGIIIASAKAPVSCPERARKRKGAGTPQEAGAGPRPSPIEISSFASEIEFRGRHSRRVLRLLGRGQLLLVARIRSPD